jgi:hypothetical protein
MVDPMTTLYNLHTDGDQYRITKFVDGEVESSYLSTETECECPAGHRESCRHRQMIPEMLARGLTNTHWFWNFDRHEAVDINGQSKALIDNLNQLADGEIINPKSTGIPHLGGVYAKDITPPAGVQVLTLDDPAALHNAIAEAVGEPLIEGTNRTATEIANTPMPEMREPLVEYLVDETLKAIVKTPLPRTTWRRL